MPVAENLVTWDVEEDLAATPRDALQDAVLIGGYTFANEPTAGFYNVTMHSTAEDVATDYGEDSDIHEAAVQFFASGATSVRTMAFPFEEHEETFAAADTFQLENAPVTGLQDVTVTVDGVEEELVYVVESPPQVDVGEYLNVSSGEVYIVESGTVETYTGGEVDGVVDAEGTLEATDFDPHVVLNADTGEGASSVTGEIVLNFSTIPWNDVFTALDNRSIDMVDLANHNYGYESIGDMDELVPWQDSNQVMRVQPYKNGQQYDRPEAGMQIAWQVGNYAPSPWTVALSHESPANALGAKALGMYAVEEADYNIFQEPFNVSIPLNSQYHRLIGTPGDDGSFEGGNDGSGPSNVLYDDQGTVRWSNSLTTAGISDDYRYLDRTRRKAYAHERATQAVKERLQEGATFDEHSQAEIEGAIEDELRTDVGQGEMFLDMSVSVPDREDTRRQDRANRIWEGTRLELTLNEPAHRMRGTISITL